MVSPRRLLFCCLTEACCNSLATVLLLNKTLKHLDLSVNFLQNTGVLILLMPLVLPTCTIRELE